MAVYVDLVLDNGEIVRIECPNKFHDELHESIEHAMKRRDWWSPARFDIVDRLIERYSNPDELIYDPFGGLMTVPYRAILKGRRGQASELNTAYFLDGVQYLKAAEREMAMPDLFGALKAEDHAA